MYIKRSHSGAVHDVFRSIHHAVLGIMQTGMAAARETFGSYADLEEGSPAWHKPGDARYHAGLLNVAVMLSVLKGCPT